MTQPNEASWTSLILDPEHSLESNRAYVRDLLTTNEGYALIVTSEPLEWSHLQATREGGGTYVWSARSIDTPSPAKVIERARLASFLVIDGLDDWLFNTKICPGPDIERVLKDLFSWQTEVAGRRCLVIRRSHAATGPAVSPETAEKARQEAHTADMLLTTLLGTRATLLGTRARGRASEVDLIALRSALHAHEASRLQHLALNTDSGRLQAARHRRRQEALERELRVYREEALDLLKSI